MDDGSEPSGPLQTPSLLRACCRLSGVMQLVTFILILSGMVVLLAVGFRTETGAARIHDR